MVITMVTNSVKTLALVMTLAACSHLNRRSSADGARTSSIVVDSAGEAFDMSVILHPDQEASLRVLIAYESLPNTELPIELEVADCNGFIIPGYAEVSCDHEWRCAFARTIELDDTTKQPLRMTLRSRSGRAVAAAINLEVLFGSSEKVHVRQGPQIAPQ